MPETDREPIYVTLSEAARRLSLSEQSLRRTIATGQLPAYRFKIRSKSGRPASTGQREVIRIKLADLEQLLEPIPTSA